MPELSASVQAFIRIAYGVLLAGTLAQALPHWRYFFVSARWRGYAEPSWRTDPVQNPVVMPVVLAVWFGAAGLLVAGVWTVAAAAVNLVLCYYFFIALRWRGLLRGFGAPGFMSSWLAMAVFLLEYTGHYARELQPVAVLALQVDFAVMMFSAGLAKVASGYATTQGMELGLVNPIWGYHWRFYASLPPTHWLFRVLNQLAWSVEVVAAILMIIPGLRFWGGLAILGTFVFIALNIRLGLLCEMVIVACFVFFEQGSLGDLAVRTLFSVSAPEVVAGPAVVNGALSVALWAYTILRPIAFLGLCWNFYFNRRFPALLQNTLEAYTNLFGIILWRVFTVDVTNFFLEIRRTAPGASEEPTLLTRYGKLTDLRYNHVGESIAVTTIFTALKYFTTNRRIFEDRLLRYARTLPGPDGSIFTFRYVGILRGGRSFEFVPAREYVVDPVRATITERELDTRIVVTAAAATSPVREGTAPGSYAKAQ